MRVVDVFLLRVDAYSAASQRSRYFGGLPGADEWVEDGISAVRIQFDEAIRYFFWERAWVVKQFRGDWGDMPDVVCGVSFEDVVYLELARFPLSVDVLVYLGSWLSEQQDVLGHDVGVEVSGVWVLNGRTGAFHAGGGLVPYDVLVELPSCACHACRQVERNGDVLAVHEDCAYHDGAEAARFGNSEDFAENPRQ